MISMTGYGYDELETEEFSCSVEIKSYNNRYLDFSLNMPPFLGRYESDVKSLLSEDIKRGRIEVYIRIRELNEDIAFHIDKKVLQNYNEAIKEISRITGTGRKSNAVSLLKLDGVLKTVKTRDNDKYWKTVEPLLLQAKENFLKQRTEEGQHTRKNILEQLETLETCFDSIKNFEKEIETRVTSDVNDRFLQIAGGEADEQRIYTEIAALLVKYSINEELSRLSGHFKAFRQILTEPGPVGKKLDFMCQEINREINTIGSKSMILEVNHSVVQMKDSLENIREQLRNVE